MPKAKEDPKQWLPEEPFPDAACSILQLWSRYCWDIAKFRGFQNPLDTVSSYTATLKQIEGALCNKSICSITLLDIQTAIASAPRKQKQNMQVTYSQDTLNSRYTIIHDIYKFAEAKAIWPNLLRGIRRSILVGAENVNNNSTSDLHPHTKNDGKILPRFLSIQQEQKLMRAVAEHIEEDGRWVALALLTWLGPRISETRRSYFSDLASYKDDSDKRYLRLCRSSDKDGIEVAHMKNRYGPRSIPEHEELKHIIQLREDFVCRSLGQQNISSFPLICFGNEFKRACTAQELSFFVQVQLRTIFGPEFFSELLWLASIDVVPDETEVDGDVPDDPMDLAADMEISSRLMRRNFGTKNYAETRLQDWESRQAMGHRAESQVSAPYSEGHLLDVYKLMSHRMITPEFHSGWHTVCHPDLSCIEQSDVGIHYVSIPQSDLEHIDTVSIDIELDRPGDDFLLEFFRKIPLESFTVKEDYISTPPGQHRGRPNSDAEHWPLTWGIAQKDLEKKRYD